MLIVCLKQKQKEATLEVCRLSKINARLFYSFYGLRAWHMYLSFFPFPPCAKETEKYNSSTRRGFKNMFIIDEQGHKEELLHLDVLIQAVTSCCT